MIRLGDVAIGRNNNFNLIRFLAASAVLVSHAWPIALGVSTPEPLLATMGYSLGTLSVFVFFAASGFFITASFDRSVSTRDFVIARGLRLFPCLAVSLLLAAFVMGPFTTILPLGEYLTHPETFTFLLRNITLAFPQFTLPGVFVDNPFPAVAGSIWTLIHEVLCYGLVFIAGVSGLLRRRRAMTIAILGYFALCALSLLPTFPMLERLEATRRLSIPFVLGMAFYLWRDRILLSAWAVLALLALAWATAGTQFGFPARMLFMVYAIFWLAYVPHGRIRQFNRLGDYSYGIYVYAFPLQGLAIWLFGPMSPWMNIAIAFPMTLFFSVLSWHLLEQPALGLRRKGARKPTAGMA